MWLPVLSFEAKISCYETSFALALLIELTSSVESRYDVMKEYRGRKHCNIMQAIYLVKDKFSSSSIQSPLCVTAGILEAMMVRRQ